MNKSLTKRLNTTPTTSKPPPPPQNHPQQQTNPIIPKPPLLPNPSTITSPIPEKEVFDTHPCPGEKTPIGRRPVRKQWREWSHIVGGKAGSRGVRLWGGEVAEIRPCVFADLLWRGLCRGGVGGLWGNMC